MFKQVLKIVKFIYKHPSNKSKRLTVFYNSIMWQLQKRLNKRSKLLNVENKYWIKIYPNSRSGSQAVYTRGRQDFHEMSFLERYIHPGDRFIDVGANIGVYTLLAASLVGPAGMVISFEASPREYERLLENVSLNTFEGFVIAHNVAISDRSGQVLFTVDKDVTNRIELDSCHYDSNNTTMSMPSLPLDDVLPRLDFAFAKIDIEGFDPLALKGAVQHLQSANPPIWMLEIKDHIYRSGFTKKGLSDWLFSFDFLLGFYDAFASRLCFPDEPWLQRANCFAIHRPSIDRIREKAGILERD